jgi:esterase/lipase superfamily enzyme
MPRIGLIAMAAAIMLAGCATETKRDLVAGATAMAGTASAATHRIHVVTTRAPAKQAGQVFDGRRSPGVHYAHVDVDVPQGHRTAAAPRPKSGDPVDPRIHFAVRDVAVLDGAAQMKAELARDIAARGGRVLVFVHGYRTHFDDAVYRFTQVVQDSGYTGVPLLFTWASAGKTLDYVYDRDSAMAARDALEDALKLAADSGATRIDLVGHSMGAWLTMEVLRQMSIGRNTVLLDRQGDVALASPDIDVDLFRSQMARVARPGRPIFVITSEDDSALRMSSRIAGNMPRVGDDPNETELARMGVIVVDVTRLKGGDRRNHSKFADNPLLVRLLGDYLDDPDAFAGSSEEITRRVRERAGVPVESGVAGITVTTPERVIATSNAGQQAVGAGAGALPRPAPRP